jgi:hypothetical protein
MDRNKKTVSCKYKDKRGIEAVASIPPKNARQVKNFKDAMKRAKRKRITLTAEEENKEVS